MRAIKAKQSIRLLLITRSRESGTDTYTAGSDKDENIWQVEQVQAPNVSKSFLAIEISTKEELKEWGGQTYIVSRTKNQTFHV